MEKNKPVIYATNLKELVVLKKKHPEAIVKMKHKQQEQLFNTEDMIDV